MKTDLARVLKDQTLKEQTLATTYQYTEGHRSRFSSSAEGRYHSPRREPSNVLIRDDQTKLCNLGSSKNLLHTVEKMTCVGTMNTWLLR